MTTVYLSPIGNDSQVDANGEPYSGGKIYTYTAGSDTPKTTYTSSAGSVAQANPIILNSRGMPASPIWLATGAYKLVLQTSAGVTVWTLDNISGINDVASSVSEWVASGLTPTYLSATTFSLVGDQTAIFQVGRRLRTTNTAGTVYSTITASAFAAVTTVTVVNDGSTALDSGLSAVSYALLSATSPSVPNYIVGTFTGTLTGGSTSPTDTFDGSVTYGGKVHIQARVGYSVTSNATSKTITGMPAQFRPARDIYGFVVCSDNGGTAAVGSFKIASTGVITVYPTAARGNWTNSGTATIDPITIEYLNV